MARRPKPGETGPRVTIKTELSASFIDGYWREIPDMSERVWLTMFSASQRYEIAIEHMITKLGGDS